MERSRRAPIVSTLITRSLSKERKRNYYVVVEIARVAGKLGIG
jgi:hypothetical protein